MKNKAKQLRQLYNVNFQLPLSMIRALLCGESDWCASISVQESVSIPNSMFQSDGLIIFEKPLPPLYRSGSARYKMGAKYAVRSCLARSANNVCDTIEIDGGLPENATSTYKLEQFDAYLKSYHDKQPKADTMKGNKLFNIFQIGGDENEIGAETYRVLVTSKQDAYKTCPDGKTVFINYSPKIELQAEYGGEVMTKNELIREWCDLYFRPESITERGKWNFLAQFSSIK